MLLIKILPKIFIFVREKVTRARRKKMLKIKTVNRSYFPLLLSEHWHQLYICIGSFKKSRFWATVVNRKWGLFSFNTPWCYQICIKCLYSYRGHFAETLGQKHCPGMRKVHLRLTCLSSRLVVLQRVILWQVIPQLADFPASKFSIDLVIILRLITIWLFCIKFWPCLHPFPADNLCWSWMRD